MNSNFERATSAAYAPARRYFLYSQGETLVSADLLTGKVTTGAGERRVDWAAAEAIEQRYQQLMASQANAIVAQILEMAQHKSCGRSQSGTTFLFCSADSKHHCAEIDWHWRALQFRGVWYRNDTIFDSIDAVVDTLPLKSKM